jgi:hypothetical protein
MLVDISAKIKNSAKGRHLREVYNFAVWKPLPGMILKKLNYA